jgi:hypothetical protein
MKKHLALSVAALLTACSGGGGGDDAPDQAPSNDALQVEVHGLQGTLSVSDGQGHTLAITSSGTHRVAAMGRGTAYTLSVQSQPASQVCTVARPTGVVAGETVVEVDCVEGAGLSLGTSDYAVDQLVLLDVAAGPTAVSASVGGVPVTLLRDENQLAFITPELPAGTHTLEVVADGRSFTRQLTISPNPLTAAPVDYLTQRAQAELVRIDALLARSDLGPAEHTLLTQLRSALQTEQSRMGMLPAADALRYARYLAANETLPEQSAALGRMRAAAARELPAGVAEDCLRHGKLFAQGVVMVAAGIGLANVTVASGPAAILFGSVAVTAALAGGAFISEGLSGIGTHCFSAKELIDQEEAANGVAATRRTAARVLPLSHTSHHFKHGEPKLLNIKARMRLSDQISSGTLATARSLRAQYARLSALVSSRLTLPRSPTLEAAAALRREQLRDVELSQISVDMGTTTAIQAQAVAQSGQLSLRFRFAQRPYPSDPWTFSFSLEHAGLEIKSALWLAQLDPPQQATDINLVMFKGGSLRGQLPLVAQTTYAIAQAPATGTAQLVNSSSGEFIYTPPADFTGTASFTYTMANEEDGTSPAGTVTVEVRENCSTGAGTSFTLECRETRPLFLRAYDPGSTYIPYISGHLLNALFGSVTSSHWTSYSEQSWIDTDKSPNAASGTAVFVSATTGTHNAQDLSFTELRSLGTYDSVAETPVARTEIQRERKRHVLHRDGGSHVPAEVVHAYAWMESYNGYTYLSFSYYTSLQMAGYDVNSRPYYTGQRTDCTRNVTLPITGAPVLGNVSVQVSSIAANGSISTLQQYTAASCPQPMDSFDTIAPAVTPSGLRLDWRTGALR